MYNGKANEGSRDCRAKRKNLQPWGILGHQLGLHEGAQAISRPGVQLGESGVRQQRYWGTVNSLGL